MVDSDTEKLFALLGQTVASLIADLRVEIIALREVLAEHRVVSEVSLNQKLTVVRDAKLPALTAETSGEMRERFFQLRRQSGELSN